MATKRRSKPSRLRLPRVQRITNNPWGAIWKVSHVSQVMIPVALRWLTWGGVDDCLWLTSSSGLKIWILTLLGTTWCLYNRSWVGSTNILMCVSALSMSFQCLMERPVTHIQTQELQGYKGTNFHLLLMSCYSAALHGGPFVWNPQISVNPQDG